MVKKAFLDDELTSIMQLTSANSINVARWLPQLFYFMFAYKQLKNSSKEIVFSVPSGNFGNVCAGMIAQKLGLPIKHFIASNNVNNVVTRYLESNSYEPKPSIQTVSNAMDVGNPSNFIRIQALYNNTFDTLKSNLSSYSFTDEETKQALDEIYKTTNYIADPHGAVGYLGCKSYLETNPQAHCVFLETAHPTKFLDVVKEVIDAEIPLPPQIKSVIDKQKVATAVRDYSEFKAFLTQL
jgi:threonine synthase